MSFVENTISSSKKHNLDIASTIKFSTEYKSNTHSYINNIIKTSQNEKKYLFEGWDYYSGEVLNSQKVYSLEEARF